MMQEITSNLWFSNVALQQKVYEQYSQNLHRDSGTVADDLRSELWGLRQAMSWVVVSPNVELYMMMTKLL